MEGGNHHDYVLARSANLGVNDDWQQFMTIA
jgi:hypothetical protein